MTRRPRRQRGFFIVWGSKNFIRTEHLPPVETTCPSCRRAAKIYGKSHRRWFTLYFVIPVFPMSSAVRFTECSACRAQFRATLDEFRSAGARKPASGFQDAIALFNEMRETPADATKLYRLMQMYVDMNEPNEAISAANSYPAALQASSSCLSLLADIYSRQECRDDALRCITAALALNPHNPQAQQLQNQLLANSV